MISINWNGQIVPANKPVITAHNRAFRYGDGFFETLLVNKGSIPLLSYHCLRIQTGLKLLSLEVEKEINEEAIIEMLDPLIDHKKKCWMRITFYRDGEGSYFTVSNKAGYCVTTGELDTDILKFSKAITGPFINWPKCPSPFSGLKSCNAQLYIQSAKIASENKWDQSIVSNVHGRPIEASYSNLFIVRNGELITPPASEGCVLGTMRAFLIDHAAELEIKINENSFTWEDLNNAEEIFLTNGISGILGVKNHDGKKYDTSFTKELHKNVVNRWKEA